MRERQEKNPSECQVFFCDNNEGKDTCETENISFSILDRGALLVGPNWLTLGMQSTIGLQKAICYVSITMIHFQILVTAWVLHFQWHSLWLYFQTLLFSSTTIKRFETLHKTILFCCFLFRFLIFAFPQNSAKMTNLLQLPLWLHSPYRLPYHQFPSREISLIIQRLWWRDKYAKCSP